MKNKTRRKKLNRIKRIYNSYKTKGGAPPISDNMLNRKTNIRRSDGTLIPLTLAAFNTLNINILKSFHEATSQNVNYVPIITMAIPVEQCGDKPVIVSSHYSVFLFNNNNNYVLTSPTNQLTMTHVNQTIRFLESGVINPNVLFAVGIHLIEYAALACTNPIDLSNAKLNQILSAVNHVLQMRCSNLIVEIKPHQELKCNIVNSYRSCNLLSDTSVLVCLTNIQTSECLASVELFKASTSFNVNEVMINSFTHPKYQGKKYNTFLRGIAICVASFVFPSADTLTSEAENPLSAKIMIKTFGATPYYLHEHDDTQPLNYDEVDYTSLPLTVDNKEHAINVSFDILQKVTAAGFC